MSLRERVYHLFEVEPEDRGLERAVNVFLLLLVLANACAVVLETVKPLRVRWETAFRLFEVFSVAVFTIEYLARLWSCPEHPRYQGRWGRLRFAFSPMALVDLLAIVPTLVPWLIPVDLRFARVLRLFRLARALKIARYSHALRTLAAVVRNRRGELGVTFLVGLVLLVFASALMYHVEGESQPDHFSSIPAAMWWSVVTLTTVGYGDIYPVSTLGRVLGGVIAFVGIGLFALPAGIVAGGLAEELQKAKRKETCPHCGKSLDGE